MYIVVYFASCHSILWISLWINLWITIPALAVAVTWDRNARESHAELVQSLDRHRLALASAASRAYIVDDACVSADRVSVYRVVDRDPVCGYTGEIGRAHV